MVNLIVSESYYPDLDMIFLLLDQLDKLIYYKCELPLFFHTYIPLSQILKNSHNNLQHTFQSQLFTAYAVKDLLEYPFSTRKLNNNTFKIISHPASSLKFHKNTMQISNKISQYNIKANIKLYNSTTSIAFST